MAVVLTLPVWSFRANWRDGVTERLSFLTDVLRATEGAEQRRSLRETPRRTVEADFLLSGPERTFFDLFVNRLGGGDMLVPLYWDIVTLMVAASAGTTNRINFNNTLREFAPGYAILMGKNALSYEVVQIASMDAGGINLTGMVDKTWPAGTKMMPLRRAVLDDIGSPSHVTAGVATATGRFLIRQGNPWTPSGAAPPVYQGRDVFLDEPNWVDALTADYDREVIRLDRQVGLPYQVDSLGRALLGQAHRWFLPGRAKLAAFRDLLYRYRGRAGSFWLPTFKHDFRLVNSPGSGATQITVENTGFQYVGGPTSGREYIAIKHAGGTILRKITSVVAGTTSATEKLNLDAPLGLALSPGQVRRISFADVARFDSDDFEITHHAGLDGLSECSSTFRTFKATRTAPLPIVPPVAAAVMTNTPCGVPLVDWVWHVRFVIMAEGYKDWDWDSALLLRADNGEYPAGMTYFAEDWAFNWYFVEDVPSGTPMASHINPGGGSGGGLFPGATILETTPGWGGAPNCYYFAQRRGQELVLCPKTSGRPVIGQHEFQHFGFNMP